MVNENNQKWSDIKFASEKKVALIVFALVGINYPLWFYFVKWMRPDLTDHLLSRVVLGAFSLGLLGYFWNKNKDHFPALRWSLVTVLNLMMGHYFWLASINQISTMHSLGIVMIMTLCFFPIDFRKGVWTFAGFCNVMAFYVSFFVESPYHNPGMLFVVVLNMSGVLLLASLIKIDREERMRQTTMELAETQEELANQRARELENAKLVSLGEMAGGVAHEINNPLAILVGSISMLKRGSSESHEKSLARAVTASERISNVVNGLLIFVGRAETQGDRFLPVKRIFATVSAFYTQKLIEEKIELRFSLEDKKAAVFCDESEIIRSLYYLVNNAIYAIGEGAERWISVEGIVTDEGTVIRVRDSGSGVPSEIVSKITNPFFTTKPIGSGMGLGLSMVHGMAHSRGGYIKLTGQKPTQFDLFLPGSQRADSTAAS